jgi:hypothetical protein
MSLESALHPRGNERARQAHQAQMACYSARNECLGLPNYTSRAVRIAPGDQQLAVCYRFTFDVTETRDRLWMVRIFAEKLPFLAAADIQRTPVVIPLDEGDWFG